jgi:hypothetical protein
MVKIISGVITATSFYRIQIPLGASGREFTGFVFTARLSFPVFLFGTSNIRRTQTQSAEHLSKSEYPFLPPQRNNDNKTGCPFMPIRKAENYPHRHLIERNHLL